MVRILFFLLFFSVSAHAEFRFRINEDLGTLDWGNGEVNSVVVQQIMEGLTTAGDKGQPLPAIASKWTSSGNSITFELRQDAKWSDGQAVCAQHFIDAWLRVLSEKFASPYAHYLGLVKENGLHAEGCYRLRVELKQPAPYFVALTSHWVLNPIRLDLIKKYGPNWMRPERLVVTGPYVLEQWARDQYYLLKKNARYFDAEKLKNSEEKLRAVVVSDDATALLLFQKGQLDWVRDIPFLDKPRLSKLAQYRLFPSFVEYHLGFGPGLTTEQRCALGAGLDKKNIPLILKGGELPAYAVVPPAMVASSKAYMQKPVQPVKFEKPLELYFYSKDIHVPLMEWVQQEWKKKTGVEVHLHKYEAKSYWTRLQKDPPEIFLSGITAAYAHPYSFLSEFLSASPANWGHFRSAEYDAAAMGGDADRAQRILISQQCGVIPLYFRQTASLVGLEWKGFQMNPMTYVYLKSLRR